MDILSIINDQNKLDVVYALASDSNQIKENAKRFVARLAAICDYADLKERWQAEFIVADDGTTVDIDSPVGKVRAMLSIVITEKGSIEGRWGIRKQSYTPVGEIALTRVACIRISARGLVYLSDSDESPFSARPQLVNGEDIVAYKIMSAILYLCGSS